MTSAVQIEVQNPICFCRERQPEPRGSNADPCTPLCPSCSLYHPISSPIWDKKVYGREKQSHITVTLIGQGTFIMPKQ